MNNYEIGEIIAKKRKEKNLSQVDLADLLGVSFQVISKWERGESSPDVIMLGKICDILGLNPMVFFDIYYEDEYENEDQYESDEPKVVYTDEEDLESNDQEDDNNTKKSSEYQHHKEFHQDHKTDADHEFRNIGAKIQRDVSGFIRNVKFRFSRHEHTIFNEYCGFARNVSFTVFYKTEFNKTDLNGISFRTSTFTDTLFNKVKLNNSLFASSTLRDCEYNSLNCVNLRIRATNFETVSINDSILRTFEVQNSSFEHSKFDDAKFIDSKMVATIFHDTLFDDCVFDRVVLRFNTFRNVTFKDCDFKSCFFDRTKFVNVILKGCKLDTMTYSMLKTNKNIKFVDVELV